MSKKEDYLAPMEIVWVLTAPNNVWKDKFNNIHATRSVYHIYLKNNGTWEGLREQRSS
jgi:hypothetical protein